MYNRTTLPSGLRVITEMMPSVRSTTVGIWADVGDGAMVSGSPAHDHRDELRQKVMIRNLPKLFDRVEALERSRSAE